MARRWVQYYSNWPDGGFNIPVKWPDGGFNIPVKWPDGWFNIPVKWPDAVGLIFQSIDPAVLFLDPVPIRQYHTHALIRVLRQTFFPSKSYFLI